VLELYADADEPGCSAAVAQQGEVMWRGVQGMADLASKTAITPSTVFDIGSVSKQFTAAAILLLRDAGRLELDDPLATHLAEFPAWSRTTTLAQLMHHTSGIPDYERLLEYQGFELTERTTQQQTVEALAEVQYLDFPPGSEWAYSNSNYVLLGEVVRRVSGQPLDQFLRTEIFEPLDLDMVVEPDAAVPGKAVSYRGSSANYEAVDHHWEQVGDGAIQTTPAEMARWGDNYRTAEVGGADWQAAVLADAVAMPPGPAGEKYRYGAGISQDEDGWLSHPGHWEGFVTSFRVSPDRATTLAVACNKEFDTTDLTRSLLDIWAPP
jgi:CubicO group peptidase (beta-lactamase class C family)